ncbi:udp-glycosyltransferase 89b2 [Quercus suber]|uniref:Udp-glycosyltransferase 89b2 n=1 Tax=Quercus suber TaxID=58331 RepID=A0AAW0JH41_QUESU
MSTTKSKTNLHIVAYPFPSAGHIIPLLDLTHLLLTRGLNVTVLVTPSNVHLLEPYLSTHPSSLKHLVLPALVPDIKPSPPHKRFLAIVRALRDLHYPFLLQWFQSHPSPPVAIISDFLLGWTHHLACELKVPRLCFSPSGAFGMSVAFSTCRDPPKNNDPGEDINFLISFPNVPNSPTYPWWQIENFPDLEADPDWEFHRNSMLANLESWGIVFNSFASLESVYFDHLKREVGHNRVWAVGPVLPLEGDLIGSATRGGASSLPCHKLMTWLDARPDNSVVYVCFGSRAVLTSKQLKVLATALECISLDKSKPQNVRAKELSDAALSAAKGGSSDKDLDELIKQLADIKKLE